MKKKIIILLIALCVIVLGSCNKKAVVEEGFISVDPALLTEENIHGVAKDMGYKILKAKDYQLKFSGNWNGSDYDMLITQDNIDDFPQVKNNIDLVDAGLGFLPASYLTDKKVENEEDKVHMSFCADSEKINGIIDRFAQSKAIGLDEVYIEMVFNEQGQLLEINIKVASEKQNGQIKVSDIRVY